MPCTFMMTSIATRDNLDFNQPGHFRIDFEYRRHYYREIQNTKAYTSETLLGQIGGFVGMQCRV